MKKINVGDIWQGDSYTDMINKVLDTNYKMYMQAGVPLKKFGLDGIAWFVYMDGKNHKGWKNIISDDENTIVEILDNINNCNDGIDRVYRLAFRRDPDNKGNRYKCKFLGYFKRSEISDNKLKRTYKKKIR